MTSRGRRSDRLNDRHCSFGLVRKLMLGQFAKLLWDPMGIRKGDSGISDSGPTELLSDCVNRPIRTPSSRTCLGAWAALCIPTGGERQLELQRVLIDQVGDRNCE